MPVLCSWFSLQNTRHLCIPTICEKNPKQTNKNKLQTQGIQVLQSYLQLWQTWDQVIHSVMQRLLSWMCFGSISVQTYPNMNTDFEPFLQSVLFHLQGTGFDASRDVLLSATKTIWYQAAFMEIGCWIFLNSLENLKQDQTQLFSPKIATQFNKETPIFFPSLDCC